MYKNLNVQNCTKMYKNLTRIVQWYKSRQKWLVSYSEYHRSYPDGNREFIRIDFPRVKTSIYNKIIDFDMIKLNKFDSFTKYRGLLIMNGRTNSEILSFICRVSPGIPATKK